MYIERQVGMRKLQLNRDWPESWQNSWHYDQREFFDPQPDSSYSFSYRYRYDRTLEALAQVVAPASIVLDVGAAQGNFSLKLAEQGHHVLWNDLREELSGYVKLKHEGGDIAYVPGNIYDLKLDKRVDCVLMTEVIEHVAHPDQFLEAAAKVLKDTGVIVLSTPNGRYFRNKLPRFSDYPDPSSFESKQFRPDSDGHIFLLHPDEIHLLAAKAGLVVSKLELFYSPLATVLVKSRGFFPSWLTLGDNAIRRLDAQLCRTPVIGQACAISMVAVLRFKHNA